VAWHEHGTVTDTSSAAGRRTTNKYSSHVLVAQDSDHGPFLASDSLLRNHIL